MKRFIATSLFALGAAGLFSAAHAAEVIKIATEGAYPPFNALDSNNKPYGFDVDIANAICEKMKAKCEIVIQDWDGMIPGLLAKKFDLISASMTINDERKKVVDFSDPYYHTKLVVMAPKASKVNPADPASFKGLSVGAQAGTTQAAYIEDKLGKAGASTKVYPTQDAANLDLGEGRIDAVVNDIFPALEWLNKEGKDCCKSAGELPGTSDGVGITVRKEDTALKARVNKALAEIRADGTYEKINKKYFSFDIYK